MTQPDQRTLRQDDSSVLPEGVSESWKRPTATGPRRSRAAAVWGTVPKHQLGLLGAILTIGLVLSQLTPFFLTAQNLTNIAQAQAVNAIMAFGVTVVMLSGSVDISMGGVLALTGMVTAMAAEAGAPAVVAVALGLAIAVACGLVNAVLVVRLGINPIVATLGTQFIFRGVAYVINNGATSIISDPTLLVIGRGKLGDVPVSVLLTVAMFVALYVGLAKLRWGRHVYATGGSETAALRSGVAVDRIRTQAFVLCAGLAGIGGLIVNGLNGVAYPQSGFGSEFVILGSVIVGGTTLLGVARGGVVGTLLGVMLFGVIFNGFNLLGLNVLLQPVIQGLLLIGAVVIDDYRRRRGAIV